MSGRHVVVGADLWAALHKLLAATPYFAPCRPAHIDLFREHSLNWDAQTVGMAVCV